MFRPSSDPRLDGLPPLLSACRLLDSCPDETAQALATALPVVLGGVAEFRAMLRSWLVRRAERGEGVPPALLAWLQTAVAPAADSPQAPLDTAPTALLAHACGFLEQASAISMTHTSRALCLAARLPTARQDVRVPHGGMRRLHHVLVARAHASRLPVYVPWLLQARSLTVLGLQEDAADEAFACLAGLRRLVHVDVRSERAYARLSAQPALRTLHVEVPAGVSRAQLSRVVVAPRALVRLGGKFAFQLADRAWWAQLERVEELDLYRAFSEDLHDAFPSLRGCLPALRVLHLDEEFVSFLQYAPLRYTLFSTLAEGRRVPFSLRCPRRVPVCFALPPLDLGATVCVRDLEVGRACQGLGVWLENVRVGGVVRVLDWAPRSHTSHDVQMDAVVAWAEAGARACVLHHVDEVMHWPGEGPGEVRPQLPQLTVFVSSVQAEAQLRPDRLLALRESVFLAHRSAVVFPGAQPGDVGAVMRRLLGDAFVVEVVESTGGRQANCTLATM